MKTQTVWTFKVDAEIGGDPQTAMSQTAQGVGAHSDAKRCLQQDRHGVRWIGVEELTPGMHPEFRERHTAGAHGLEYAEVLEHLLGARRQALAA